MADKITSRAENYSEWYNDLVKAADLADHSSVRGCMVIKPYGYAIWENMQQELDKRFKETGHVNAYFPLFIPKSFLSREAAHVDGFAKECAVVTHHRLKTGPDGKSVIVDPDAKLEEELIVRPTSETIIWNTYRDWIQSYRDLPLLINQWANVVRWELRTRLFLRTTEFLWQEGHTAHATSEEAIAETEQMLEVYASFAENFLAMPVIKGRKTDNERFAGAVDTYCIESMMQDGKALQAGTSHFLGQNFAKAFEVKFMTPENKEEFVWATSWGVSTRLIGALIMCHSDDDGLILPPTIAPIQVVLIPIYKNDEEWNRVVPVLEDLATQLKALGIRIKIDLDRQRKPGWKFAQWELKGVPLRLALGCRDLDQQQVELARRDNKQKITLPLSGLATAVHQLLPEIQNGIFQKALDFRNTHIHEAQDWETFKKVLQEQGGFIKAIGMALLKLNLKSKRKLKPRFVVFHWMPLKKMEFVCIAENLLIGK
jgi:prolyl-tRNA synthetase